MNSRKTLFIAAGIFSMMTAIFSLVIVILIAGFASFTPFAIQEFLFEIGLEMSINDIQSFLNTSLITNSISIVANCYVIIVSFNFAFSKKLATSRSAWLVIAVIISWLFSSIITAILLTIAFFSNKPAPAPIVNMPVSKQQTEEIVKKEMEKIRALYQNNAISKEEYEHLVKDLFAKLNFEE